MRIIHIDLVSVATVRLECLCHLKQIHCLREKERERVVYAVWPYVCCLHILSLNPFLEYCCVTIYYQTFMLSFWLTAFLWVCVWAAVWGSQNCCIIPYFKIYCCLLGLMFDCPEGTHQIAEHKMGWKQTYSKFNSSWISQYFSISCRLTHTDIRVLL